MPVKRSSDTSEHILIVAEKLFADFGYSAISLRKITETAKVNLASLNYHHFDKATLYRKILARRLRQLSSRRLALLEHARTLTGSEAIPLEQIFDALGRPLLLPDEALGDAGARLLGRLWIEHDASVELKDEMRRSDFHFAMNRFGQAIRRHVPQLPPSEFVWQLSLVVGSLHHAAATLTIMPRYTSGLCRANDGEAALRNFIHLSTRTFSTS